MNRYIVKLKTIVIAFAISFLPIASISADVCKSSYDSGRTLDSNDMYYLNNLENALNDLTPGSERPTLFELVDNASKYYRNCGYLCTNIVGAAKSTINAYLKDSLSDYFDLAEKAVKYNSNLLNLVNKLKSEIDSKFKSGSTYSKSDLTELLNGTSEVNSKIEFTLEVSSTSSGLEISKAFGRVVGRISTLSNVLDITSNFTSAITDEQNRAVLKLQDTYIALYLENLRTGGYGRWKAMSQVDMTRFYILDGSGNLVNSGSSNSLIDDIRAKAVYFETDRLIDDYISSSGDLSARSMALDSLRSDLKKLQKEKKDLIDARKVKWPWVFYFDGIYTKLIDADNGSSERKTQIASELLGKFFDGTEYWHDSAQRMVCCKPRIALTLALDKTSSEGSKETLALFAKTDFPAGNQKPMNASDTLVAFKGNILGRSLMGKMNAIRTKNDGISNAETYLHDAEKRQEKAIANLDACYGNSDWRSIAIARQTYQ